MATAKKPDLAPCPSICSHPGTGARGQRGRSVVRYGAAALLAGLLCAVSVASAQNKIAHDKWEGFAIRKPEGAFDRCVLYNRAIGAISISPYEMLGISRDAAGHVGLLVFYTPSTLAREKDIPVVLKLDDHPPVTLTGRAISDFHIGVDGPLGAPVLAMLRTARRIEVSAEGHVIRFDVTDVGGALQTLSECVKANAR